MQRTGEAESNQQSAAGREADSVASRPTPLTLVSGAVAGDDLRSVTATASNALGRPLAIAIPGLGEPVIHPVGAMATSQVRDIRAYAIACVNGTAVAAPDAVAEAVPIRIGDQVVGIAVAVEVALDASGSGGGARGGGGGGELSLAEQRAWLEAAAAAASVTALIGEAQHGDDDDARAALLLELASGPPENLADLLARARRLGCELGNGASALCGQGKGTGPAGRNAVELTSSGILAANTGDRTLLGFVPVGSETDGEELAARLRADGMTVALSAPRRDPGVLHEAVREAELLVKLAGTSEGPILGPDETYRLLIGVLLRDPDEVAQLRERTISPLVEYDARHDTDLVATLRAFLAHDGSTTETADAMNLHRHTVGYRLARVHEVSGLSPYESDGRERLSLGLKAAQIMEASGLSEHRDG
jgi:PucR C-terminal helix-turn-helix domain